MIVDEGKDPLRKTTKKTLTVGHGKSEPVGGTLPDGKKVLGGVYTHKSDDEASEKVGDATVTPVKVRKMNEEDLEEDMEAVEMGIPAAEDDMGVEDPMPEEPGMEDEGPEDGQDVEVDVPGGCCIT